MFKVLKRTENLTDLDECECFEVCQSCSWAKVDGEQNIDNCGNVSQLVMFRVLQRLENGQILVIVGMFCCSSVMFKVLKLVGRRLILTTVGMLCSSSVVFRLQTLMENRWILMIVGIFCSLSVMFKVLKRVENRRMLMTVIFCSSSIVFKVLKRMENRQTLTVLVVDNRPRHEGQTDTLFFQCLISSCWIGWEEGVGGREGGGGGKRGRGWGGQLDKLLVIFSANLALMCVCEEEGTVAVLYNRGLCWV